MTEALRGDPVPAEYEVPLTTRRLQETLSNRKRHPLRTGRIGM